MKTRLHDFGHRLNQMVRNYQIFKTQMDMVYRASQKLRTIDPDNKEADGELLEYAQRIISEAKCVYILGYGFDVANSKRLKLDKSLRLSKNMRKCVLFTNYGDSNRVNKQASELFYGSFDQFLPPKSPIRGNPTTGPYYCEKSIRDVYEALELDFDTL
jgi:hypothetical protein